jgi:hypothetical protein
VGERTSCSILAPHDAVDGERYGGNCGHLVDNLQATWACPKDIDTVVLSHAHGDHIGGATIESVPTFREALYWFSETEWEHWLQPDVIAERPFLAGKLPPLMDYGQVELAEDEVEVAPGVRLLFAPGHTPGHMHRDHGAEKWRLPRPAPRGTARPSAVVTPARHAANDVSRVREHPGRGAPGKPCGSPRTCQYSGIARPGANGWSTRHRARIPVTSACAGLRHAHG